jgi:hypothetical protein
MPLYNPTTGADLSPAAILAPATSARNTVQPTGAAVIPLTVMGAVSQSAKLVSLQDSSAAELAYVTSAGVGGLKALSIDVNSATAATISNAFGGATITLNNGGELRLGGPNAVPVSMPSMTGTVVQTGHRVQPTVNQGGAGGWRALHIDPILTAEGSGSKRLIEAGYGGTAKWALTKEGLPEWIAAGNQQTTVGAAGAASALPATPTKYLKVVDSAGTTLVIPAYAP